MSDLISKHALIDAMYHEAFEKDSDEQMWDGGCWIRYKMFERVIDSIDTVSEESINNGEWVDGSCSICGEHAPFWCMASTYYLSKYCPNCGAKMGVDSVK